LSSLTLYYPISRSFYNLSPTFQAGNSRTSANKLNSELVPESWEVIIVSPASKVTSNSLKVLTGGKSLDELPVTTILVESGMERSTAVPTLATHLNIITPATLKRASAAAPTPVQTTRPFMIAFFPDGQVYQVLGCIITRPLRAV